MCGECRAKAADQILDLVEKGYGLDASVRLVRDATVSQSREVPEIIETLDDLWDLLDDINAAGTVLAVLQENDPAGFEQIVLSHAQKKRAPLN